MSTRAVYRCATVGCDFVVSWRGQYCLACRLDRQERQRKARQEPECDCDCEPRDGHWCLVCPAHGALRTRRHDDNN